MASLRVCSSQSSLLFLSSGSSSSSSSTDLLPISRATVSFKTNNNNSRPRASLIINSPNKSSHRFDRRILKVEAATEKTNQQVVEQLDNTGGGGDGFGSGGGGGDNNNNGNNNNNNEGEGEEEGDLNNNNNKKMAAMSMSQKLTLAYAALIGVGGVMGYIKSGSQKSLAAGGISASLLYFVYTQLPTKPVLASSLGLVLSAALLGVMGSRFKKSGKIFPAGVVSIVSLVMTGGYLHGIMRSAMHG